MDVVTERAARAADDEEAVSTAPDVEVFGAAPCEHLAVTPESVARPESVTDARPAARAEPSPHAKADAHTIEAAPADAAAPATGSARRYYTLALLVAVGLVAWIDRNVLATLLESIKAELGFSDTELGLLGGAAFGLFYAVVGLPVALLADRGNRRSLIALAVGLWSVMTALCGLAGGFASLFLARVGVGVGEAGGTPPSHSLISDLFPPERRAFALGMFYLYVPLGFLIGYSSGGWLDEHVGWRFAFVLAGLPGVLLAVIVRLTVREPPRGAADGIADTGPAPSLRATLRAFSTRRSLRHLPLAGAVHGIGAFAAAVWLPSYFVRAFGVGSAEAGVWIALAYGLGGIVGVLCGGALVDRLVSRTGDPRWYAWGSAVVVAATVPCSALVYLARSPLPAAAALVVAMTLWHMFLGPVTAAIQALAGLRRRAVAAALYLFLVNLVSTGLGPFAVGAASDLLGARLGSDSLRYALLAIVTSTSAWAAVHFFWAARSLPADLAAARDEAAQA
jgi:predicted MFS family arabinose efflux permease